MSSLPESLMHFRTDLEEAIGREQAARLRQGRRRQRLVALAAGILVIGLLVTPAFGIGDRLLSLIQSKPTPLDVQAPAWSPDGRTIVFVSWRDGNGEVYAMDANGSGPRNLTQNPAKRCATCLVARRAQHRVCEQSKPVVSLQTWTWTVLARLRPTIRDLRHERRREQEAEPHAGSCERRPSNLVTRRAEDRVLARPRPRPRPAVCRERRR